jgi:single-strand DNA-binding protein
MNETTVTITGNVITDVKSRRTGEGVRVSSFRMASNERRFDKMTGEWVDGDRLYVTVTCWRRLATGVSTSLLKGDPVVVTGRLFTRGYEVEGQKRSVTELEATAVGPDLSRCSAELTRVHRAGSEEARGAAASAGEESRTDVAATAAVPGQSSSATSEEERPALAMVGGA